MKRKRERGERREGAWVEHFEDVMMGWKKLKEGD